MNINVFINTLNIRDGCCIMLCFHLCRIVTLSSYKSQPKACEFCERLYDGKCRSPHLLSMLVDISEEAVRENPAENQSSLDRALEVR